MFSFLLLIGGNNKILSEKVLNIYSGISQKLPIPTDSTVMELPDELNLLLFQPVEKKITSLHHVFQFEDNFIYSFGTIFGEPDVNVSEYLFAIYDKKGEKAVQQVDGSFSFIIYNSNTKKLKMICDAVGDRRVHYFYNEDNIIISSLDILIFSTGLVSDRINKLSVLEMLAFNSSRIGNSIIKDIENIKPYEILEFRSFNPTKKISCPFSDLDPILKNSELKKKINDIIKTLRDKSKSYIMKANQIEFDLTAGKDSRSVFSLLKDLVDKKRSKVRTRGEEHCLDNLFARKVTKIYGFKHENVKLMKIDNKEFKSNLYAFALFCNGNTNGIRTIDEINYKDVDDLRFGGVRTTPESFKIPKIIRKENVIEEISKFFLDQYFKFPMVSETEYCKINEYINQIVKDIYSINHNIEFTLKALVLYMLYSNSGILINHRNWQLQNIEPFLSQDVAKLYFLTPLQKLKDFMLYPEIVNKFAPEIISYPINGNYFNRLSKKKNTLLIKLYSLYTRIIKRLKRNELSEKLIYQDSVGYAFKNDYKQFIENLLKESEIINREILSQSVINRIVNEHMDGIKNNQDLIGILLIIESFLQTMKEITHAQ